MAKAKYISPAELDVIRIGVRGGFSAPAIARYLNRKKMTIYNHIKKMQESDMMAADALDFLSEQICEGIRANEAKHNGR